MNQVIADKLKLLPDTPGVYKMLDDRGTVIYVGKAVSLKNRVSQYFQAGKDHAPKVRAMVSHIADFETIGVTNEMEALSLESNLIKEFMPKYNILLKDDKHFPYVRIDLKQDFPRVEVVRRIRQDGATYLGPYLSAIVLREQVAIIRAHFPIRPCRKDMARAIARRERPCLMYHIGKCCAPCSGQVSRETYHGYVKEVVAFLEGRTEKVLSELKGQMAEAAENLEFERAARLRDQIRSIEGLNEKQVAIFPKETEADVFAPAKLEDQAMVFALFLRQGKIVGTEHFSLTAVSEDDPADILSAFLTQFYDRDGILPPKEVLLSCPVPNADAIGEMLSERAGRKVKLAVPQRGDKKKLTELAEKNGRELLEKEKALREKAWDRDEGAAVQLAGLLGLDEFPTRMECFDNSHIMGTDTVSSMVVFTDGKPDKDAYRRFRIRAEAGGDDLIAMEEVLTRRFKKGPPWPDLIIIDGGKTQLAVAEKVLNEAGLPYLNVIALAESQELIYTPDSDEPIVLPRSSPMLHLLQRIRDEAHRFAISYHRSLHQRNALLSVLDGIAGIGDTRKRALFDAFITRDAIAGASVEELAKVKGMSRPAAEAVYRFFHPANDIHETETKKEG